jgi:lysophospholipase L1-like esterase
MRSVQTYETIFENFCTSSRAGFALVLRIDSPVLITQMRKIQLTFFIGLLACAAMGQSIQYDTIRYAREYYAERIAQFQKEPIKKRRVIFLGNSITEYGDWRQLLNDSTIINRGIAADNTFGILDRLEDVISRQPGKLFIEVGINDLSQGIPVDLITKNIFAIVENVHRSLPQTKIYVHGIFPTNDRVKKVYPDAFNKNDLAETVNRELKRKATEIGFTYVDFGKKLKDKSGQLDNRYADADGLHLNMTGYQLWVRFLKSKGYL